MMTFGSFRDRKTVIFGRALVATVCNRSIYAAVDGGTGLACVVVLCGLY